MTFNLQLALGRERLGFRPCIDGQFCGVIKPTGETSGDSEWLRGHGETLKKNISFICRITGPFRSELPGSHDRNKRARGVCR